MNSIYIMVAVDERGGFGLKGKIPWHFPEDLKFFQTITKNSICVMGRRTYEDLLGYAKKRQGKDDKLVLLEGRDCVVLSRNKDFKAEGATVFPGLRQVRDHYALKKDNRIIFVIGGEKLFIEALSWCEKIFVTIVKGDFKCDRHFPIRCLGRGFKMIDGIEKKEFYWTQWVKKNNSGRRY